jgi:predicted metal-dependent hydrolase
MIPDLAVDDLRFEVVLSPRRRTMELSVERNGDLVIRAPEGATGERLEAFIREKRTWVYRKVAEKEALRHAVPVKEYVSGESFPYLGRSYRLLLVNRQDVPLRLEAGRFRLLRSDAQVGRAHFIRWYTEHGRKWLRRRVHALASRVGVEPGVVDVRDLGYRWGSCGARRTLNFNWATVLLPPSIVEYVVVHELMHLRERNHTPDFWRRVERVLPDYARRKAWLAERGASVTAIRTRRPLHHREGGRLHQGAASCRDQLSRRRVGLSSTSTASSRCERRVFVPTYAASNAAIPSGPTRRERPSRRRTSSTL